MEKGNIVFLCSLVIMSLIFVSSGAVFFVTLMWILALWIVEKGRKEPEKEEET